MKKLLIILLLCVPLQARYLKQKSITLNHLKVGGSDQTDFPYILCYNGATNCSAVISEFADVGHGGLVQHTSSLTFGGRTYTVPDDWIISSTTCNSPTKMKWEIGAYTNTSGSLIAYAKAPTVSHTADTIPGYVCYDDASVSTWQGDITNTWTPYVYVNHGSDGTTAYLYDSSPTAATISAVSGSLTTNTSTGAPPLAMGAGEGDIDNVSSVDLTSTLGSFAKTTHFGLEAWVYWFSGTGGTDTFIIGQEIDTTTAQFNIVLDGNDGVGKFAGCVGKANTGYDCAVGGTFSTGTWFHLMVTGDGTTVTLYINGSSVGTKAYSTATTSTANTQGFSTGCQWRSNSSSCTGRAITRTDEFRVILGTTPGADYATASYNSISSPSTFVTLGSTVSPPSDVHHRVRVN